ncbi:MAG: YwaF family protein [Gammaproteobacteria bacterium]|nr:YwaF family protein [Gammaproteobacteria bacterium]
MIFGGAHLLSLTVLATFGYMAIRLGRSGSEATRRRIKRGMMVLLLVTFAAGHFWFAFHGEWAVAERLPLHLCGAMV